MTYQTLQTIAQLLEREREVASKGIDSTRRLRNDAQDDVDALIDSDDPDEAAIYQQAMDDLKFYEAAYKDALNRYNKVNDAWVEFMDHDFR